MKGGTVNISNSSDNNTLVNPRDIIDEVLTFSVAMVPYCIIDFPSSSSGSQL